MPAFAVHADEVSLFPFTITMTITIQQNIQRIVHSYPTFCCEKLMLAVLLLFFSLAISAQPRCKVTLFGVENGLPAGITTSIAQSTDNLIWVTSWNGLSCYDGYRFTTFRNYPGKNLLPTNHLIYVTAGTHGNLWTETYTDEMFFFDSRKCQFVPIKTTSGADGKKHATLGSPAPHGVNSSLKLRKAYPLANGKTWLIGRGNDHYRVTDSLIAVSDDAIKHFSLPGVFMHVRLDSKGNEWCFTSQGIYLQGEKKLSDLPFDHLAEVKGTTWFATPDGSLGKYHNGKIVLVKLAAAVKEMSSMIAVDNRYLAFATDRGVLIYDTSTQHETLYAVQNPSNPVNGVSEIFLDKRKRLWCFNSGNGVTMIDISSRKSVWMNATLPDEADNTRSNAPVFHIDNNNTVWMIPTNGTFAYYDETKSQLVPYILTPDNGISGKIARVRRAFSDRQGNLWLMAQHNLALVNFHYMNVMTTMRSDYENTRAVYQLPGISGVTLAGTVDGKLLTYDSAMNLTAQHQIAKNVYAIYCDSRHRMWYASKGDGIVVIYPDGTRRHYKHDSSNGYSLSSNDVYDIMEDGKGRMLVATFGGGLNIIDETDPQAWRFIHSGNDLKQYDTNRFAKIRRIARTKSGVILLSTTDGLLTYSENFKTYDRVRFFVSSHIDAAPTSLYSSAVMQTCVMNNGSVYVATLGGGLQRIASESLLKDNLTFEGVNTHSIETIFGLVCDNNDNLWVIGESRIACLYSTSGKFVEFGAKEIGDVNITEARPSHHVQTDRIVLGIEGGILSFVPKNMKKSHYQPKIVFTAINYPDNQGMQPLLNIEQLDLDTDHRTFTIYFSALDYNDNSGIRYAYKLDDGSAATEDGWTYTRSGMNSVSFSDFPAGSHTLYVRSTNSDGVWMDNVQAIKIYAEPTFIESWWGRMIVILILILAIGYAIQRYMHRKKAEIREEATEQADARKVRFLLQTPEIIDEDKQLMDRLLEYIGEHISEPELKVDDLASNLNLGRSAFYTRIRRVADMTPNDFLRHVRMQRAEELVKKSHLTFSQIAYHVGFTDPKYFGKCFKKHTGMSPSEYREKFASETETIEPEEE